MIQNAKELLKRINKLSEELVFESELFTMNEYELRIVEEYLDQIIYSLTLLIEDKKGIIWFEHNVLAVHCNHAKACRRNIGNRRIF